MKESHFIRQRNGKPGGKILPLLFHLLCAKPEAGRGCPGLENKGAGWDGLGGFSLKVRELGGGDLCRPFKQYSFGIKKERKVCPSSSHRVVGEMGVGTVSLERLFYIQYKVYSFI